MVYGSRTSSACGRASLLPSSVKVVFVVVCANGSASAVVVVVEVADGSYQPRRITRNFVVLGLAAWACKCRRARASYVAVDTRIKGLWKISRCKGNSMVPDSTAVGQCPATTARYRLRKTADPISVYDPRDDSDGHCRLP
eukprot:scaffold9371_cov211-Amphora_coffeaeformis.AAC.16